MPESKRMWASASFVGVLIVIGLPLWWKTTEVYRVALPYDKISSLDDLPHIATTHLTVLANDEPTAAEIADLIEKTFEGSDVIRLIITKSILSNELHHALNTMADEHEALEELAGAVDLNKFNTFYVVQRKPLFQDVWLAGERVAFFRDAKASSVVAHVLQRWVYAERAVAGARADGWDEARRMRMPPGAAYHVVLSVVHPRPDALRVVFDAAEALEDYVGSFVDELSILHNFTLQSQWLHLLDYDFQAKEVKDSSEWGRHWAVRRERLHVLLTRLEERAATHVSAHPTINLALYALPCHTAPLLIYGDDGKMIPSPVQAFMSPRWGGVMLDGPTAAQCQSTMPEYRPTVRLVMGTFLAQLRRLVGIPDTEPISGAQLEPLRSVSPRRWELDTVLRVRTVEHIASAKRTLQSLAQLLGEISNIVINDEAGASINAAVAGVELASSLLLSGDAVEAYRVSLQAYTDAETAFMEPSLLALLYFPDDQKYAIYIPLFLPIMFPVVLSLKNLFLWFCRKPARACPCAHKEKID